MLKEQDFYRALLDLIDKDMADKKLKPIHLINKVYEISRTQYYNIEKLANGENNVSRLSHKRLMELCKYYGMDIKEIWYEKE